MNNGDGSGSVSYRAASPVLGLTYHATDSLNLYATFKNAPGTKRTGWELSGSTLLTPHWRATLAASQIDATFSRAFASGASNVASGNKIPGIPQHFLFSELLWSSQSADGAKRLARRALAV